MIHFWLPTAPSMDEVLRWRPDEEPSRYASAEGHNIIELFRRLAAEQVSVTLGPHVARGTAIVVEFMWSAFIPGESRRASIRAMIDAAQAAGGRLVLIRSDAPPHAALPIRPVREYMPTASSVREPWQRWLPPLPQRGLLPRRAERRGRIESVAFKGNPENVHPVLKSRAWSDALAERGIQWLLDVPSRTSGSDQTWHDFREVDIVLCMRSPERSEKYGSVKPATKVINAWLAGCVPIAEREPGYLELGRDRRDIVFVNSPEEALEVIDWLRANTRALTRLEQAGRERGGEFDPVKMIDRWKTDLLDVAEMATGSARGRIGCRGRVVLAQGRMEVEDHIARTRQRMHVIREYLRPRQART